MKIGLEYEGVIVSWDGDITRWKSIPENLRSKICKLAEDEFPCDNYDCLAEARMHVPVENPTVDSLSKAFFDRVSKVDMAFKAYGYSVVWGEQKIPEKIHEEILQEFDLSVKAGVRKKKLTFRISNLGVSDYWSHGNMFRGGGIHINVSHVLPRDATGMALSLRTILQPYQFGRFMSNYRNELLFRFRSAEDTRESIAEFLSFGWNMGGSPNDQVTVNRAKHWMGVIIEEAKEHITGPVWMPLRRPNGGLDLPSFLSSARP